MADITSSEGGGGRAARLAAATEGAIEAVAAAGPGLELSAACEALTGEPWALRHVSRPGAHASLHGAPVEVRRWLAVGLRAGFEFSQGEKIETERWRMLQGELDAARRERDHYRKALDGCLTRLERANVVLEAAVKLVDHWIDEGFRSDSPERAELEAGLRDAVRAFQLPVEPSGSGDGQVYMKGAAAVLAEQLEEGKAQLRDVLAQPNPFLSRLRPGRVVDVGAPLDSDHARSMFGASVVETILDGSARDERPKRRPIIDRILGRVCRLEARQERLADRVKRLEELAPKVVDDFTPGPGVPVDVAGWSGGWVSGQVRAVTPPKPAGSFSEYALREEVAAGRIRFGRVPADVEKLQARVEQLETLVGANAVREDGVEPADLLGRVDAMWERFVSALVVTRSSPDVARRERGFRVQGAWRVGTVDDVDGELDVTAVLSHGWAVVGSVHGTSLYAANVRLPKSTAGVVAVTDEALRELCVEVARLRAERGVRPWLGDPEQVRLVWDEFLSGHDARLLT